MSIIKLQPQFKEILFFIRGAKTRVFSAANTELIELYWQIGQHISKRLTADEWGKKAVEQLAVYIQTQEPGIKGFERRNLYRMRQFYETYPEFQIVSPVVTQLSCNHPFSLQNRRGAFILF